jgi:uncharacterized membrane protein YphA (DoxX/SURF4 family)
MLLDKITTPGRFFLAIPMIVFGIQHFLYAEFVATLVPTWIPGKMFWTYFAGLALFCSGLAILLHIFSRLAAALLSIMIFAWVLILHIPRIFIFSNNHSEFINLFNALFMCGGAYMLANTTPGKYFRGIERVEGKIGLLMVSISLLVFGIEHLVQGRLVFIVGAEPYPVFGAEFWIFLSGPLFIAGALGIWFSKRSAEVASILGVFIFIVTMAFYLPQFFNSPYTGHILATLLKGVAMSGSMFILARMLAKENGYSLPGSKQVYG